jgi:hypothetical protein
VPLRAVGWCNRFVTGKGVTATVTDRTRNRISVTDSGVTACVTYTTKTGVTDQSLGWQLHHVTAL